MREDGSILVTAIYQQQLWYVSAPTEGARVEPQLIHTYDQPTTGIIELEPDVFYVSTSTVYTLQESCLHRVDLRHWTPGELLPTQPVLRLDQAGALNGSCVLAPNVVLLADSFAGLIWIVDLSFGGKPSAHVWLKHPSMDYDPHSELVPPQPGINGIRYAPRTGYLYYTSTAHKLFMRVSVDPITLNPAGPPELVAAGNMRDDFCVDENAGVAYVTTHRENTVERVPLNLHSGQFRETVASTADDEELIGPSSVAWRRGANDYGSIAYITTDGGVVAPPPDGIVRPSRLLRAEFG